MIKKQVGCKKITRVLLGSLITLLFLFLTTFLVVKPAFTEVYVDCNALPGGDGSSWANAFTSIQAGIDAADSENQEVWVAEGTYNERITLSSGVALYGGFTGTETALEERDYENNRAIINGQQGGAVVTGANNSKIDGFSIVNGRAQYGGGIYCAGVYVEILNNTLTSNQATSNGGGIYCNSCSPYIYNNTITNNTAQSHGGGIYGNSCSSTIGNNMITYNDTASCGGGIYLSNGSPVVEDNTISRNESGSSGGGIYHHAGSHIRRNIITENRSAGEGGGIYETNTVSTIEDNTIADNYAAGHGGGISCNNNSGISFNEITANRSGGHGGGISCTSSSSPAIGNNHIAANICDSNGGGIFCWTSSAQIYNCLVVGNRAWHAGGIYVGQGGVSIINCVVADNHCTGSVDGIQIGGNSTLKNCILWGNGDDLSFGSAVSVTYCNIEDGDAGAGNISEGPLFEDPDNGDYRLQTGSPCIDMGDPDPQYNDTDWTQNDMGIYGGPDPGVAEGEIPPPPPGIIYVDINASAGGDGRSWATAYQSIQDGLQAADYYNEDVWVCQGTYNERITLRSGVALYGGFAGTETAPEDRDYGNNRAIINGQQGGAVVTGANNSRIDGFSIVNGRATYGGGIYCEGVSVLILNNTLTSNHATSNGGGIYCNSCSPYIYNNTITNNTAQSHGGGIYGNSCSSYIGNNTITYNESAGHGGGIYLSNGSPVVEDNTISRNESGSHGGGIYHHAGSHIRRNIITENRSEGEGGGIYETNTVSTIADNTIADNYAVGNGGGISCNNNSGISFNEITANRSGGNGGGIWCNGGSPAIGNNHLAANICDIQGGGIRCTNSSAQIYNCLVVGNRAWHAGGIFVDKGESIINCVVADNHGTHSVDGIYTTGNSILKNCILWGNGDDLSFGSAVSVTYCNIEDGDAGFGNISEGPLFEDPDNGDYRLQTGSPCIDMGDPDPEYNDIDWTQNDMGIYGGPDPGVAIGEVPPPPPGIIYVDINASAGGDGRSWATAYQSIQTGLQAADYYNEDVWVCQGTYNERITLRSGVALYGGFAGTETAPEERDYENNRTIINGQQGGSVVTGSHASIIDGFSIVNGRAQYGGGIYCEGVYVAIRNNTLTSNHATSNGGGIYCNSHSPEIYNNTITNNTAQSYGGGIYGNSCSSYIGNNTITYNESAGHGGGIYLSNGTPKVEDNTISRNESGNHGGGIYHHAGSHIRRNIITENRSAGEGGGIYETNTASTIANNTIADNYAVGSGGGISCNNNSGISFNEITANRSGGNGGGIWSNGGSPAIGNNHLAANICDGHGGGIRCTNSSAQIYNCLVVGNRAWHAGGIYVDQGESIINCVVADNHGTHSVDGIYIGGNSILKNCILWGNGDDLSFGATVSVTYCDIEDGDAGFGNISEGPLFEDPDNGDYRLQTGSPCIDMGDPDPQYNDTDWTQNDMGIYGGPDPGIAIGEVPPPPPGIIYVDINASAGGDGRSWATAYQSIQTGLQAADYYNEDVWVCQGTYNERITLSSGVALYGGFAGTETALDQRDYENNRTIINGQQGGPVVTGAHASIIDGFNIVNGRAQYGGGIYCEGVYVEIRNNTLTSNHATSNGGGIYCNTYYPPYIYNNTITNNTAQSYGGGIYGNNCSSTIANNTITYNDSGSCGGGIYLSNGSPKVEDNTISQNESGSHGGGIYHHAGSHIRRNIITENRSEGQGGGIYETNTVSTIANNTIADNYAVSYGGGILCNNGSSILNNEITTNHSGSDGGGICCVTYSPTIGKNRIIANISDADGGGICCRDTSGPTIRNNLILSNQAASCGAIRVYTGCPTIINNTIIANNSGICANSCTTIINSILWANGDDLADCSATYSDIEDGDEGEGNISEGPLFVEPSNGDYHLQPGSPCIDAGDPDPDYNDEDWSRNDMGCFGGPDPLGDISILSVTPSTLDFGEVDPGSYAEKIFIVKNLGPGTLSGTASTPLPFSIISGGSYNLAHGEIQEVVVRFSPTDSQSYSEMVNFSGGAGATCTVTGVGSSCAYSISPSEPITYAFTGGTGSIEVTAPAGCSWEAVSNNPGWLTITSGASGSGDGTVSYSVDANPDLNERTGTINIAGEIFTVHQEGEEPTGLCGDADGNGYVDIFDALLVAEYDAGLKTSSEVPGFAGCDVDCSGSVDIFDALMIAEYDAGLIGELECCPL